MNDPTGLNLEGNTTHELLAQALRKRITLGGLPTDGRLPTERQLALGLGVSRNTVRTAVRTLAAEGLIRTERGRNGGSFVQSSPDGDRLRSRTAASWRQSIEDYYSVRLALEPLAARWAASRSTAAERATLMTLVAEHPGDLATYHQMDSRLHMFIAQIARFDLLEQAIGRARLEMFRELNTLWLSFGSRSAASDTPGDGIQHFEGFRCDHLPIVQAIDERRAEDAEAAMAHHLREARGQFAHVLKQTAGSPKRQSRERP